MYMYFTCIPHFTHIFCICISCIFSYFSDGRDHAQCCTNRLIPEQCLDYCRGHNPEDFDVDSHSQCLDFAEDIISCFVEGQCMLSLKLHTQFTNIHNLLPKFYTNLLLLHVYMYVQSPSIALVINCLKMHI